MLTRRIWSVAVMVGFGWMLLSLNVQAQGIYRIVGADGKVTFSDKPSVQTPAQVLDIRVNSGPTGQANFSYELRQAVAQFPVVLYSTRQCAPCDAGRRLLQQRGVPFTEKTVNSTQDMEALQKMGANPSLPLLTIGSQQIQGFSEPDWQQYLSAAAYPEQNSLPANYRHNAATALVEPVQPSSKKAPAPPKPAPVATPEPVTLPTRANPAGIQF